MVKSLIEHCSNNATRGQLSSRRISHHKGLYGWVIHPCCFKGQQYWIYVFLGVTCSKNSHCFNMMSPISATTLGMILINSGKTTHLNTVRVLLNCLLMLLANFLNTTGEVVMEHDLRGHSCVRNGIKSLRYDPRARTAKDELIPAAHPQTTPRTS